MHATKALALTLASSKMINAFLTLHPPNINSPYLDSLLDFQLDSKLELYVDSFRSTLYACIVCQLVVLLAWYLSIFVILLALKKGITC